MQVRENIIDKQRVASSILKSEKFLEDEKERLQDTIRDIGSLVDHSNFLFERLESEPPSSRLVEHSIETRSIKMLPVVGDFCIHPPHCQHVWNELKILAGT